MINEEPKPYRPPVNTPISKFATGVDLLPPSRVLFDPISEYEGTEEERKWGFRDAFPQKKTDRRIIGHAGGTHAIRRRLLASAALPLPAAPDAQR